MTFPLRYRVTQPLSIARYLLPLLWPSVQIKLPSKFVNTLESYTVLIRNVANLPATLGTVYRSCLVATPRPFARATDFILQNAVQLITIYMEWTRDHNLTQLSCASYRALVMAVQRGFISYVNLRVDSAALVLRTCVSNTTRQHHTHDQLSALLAQTGDQRESSTGTCRHS